MSYFQGEHDKSYEFVEDVLIKVGDFSRGFFTSVSNWISSFYFASTVRRLEKADEEKRKIEFANDSLGSGLFDTGRYLAMPLSMYLCAGVASYHFTSDSTLVFTFPFISEIVSENYERIRKKVLGKRPSLESVLP